jgi:hypothetical protein
MQDCMALHTRSGIGIFVTLACMTHQLLVHNSFFACKIGVEIVCVLRNSKNYNGMSCHCCNDVFKFLPVSVYA